MEDKTYFIINSALGTRQTCKPEVVAYCVELLEKLDIPYNVLKSNKKHGKYVRVKDVYAIG